MTQTAFILILPSDEARGRQLTEQLRDKHGHACRLVSTIAEAIESIRTRVPDVVVAVSPLNGADTITPLARALDDVGPDATLLALSDGPPLPSIEPKHIRYRTLANPDDDTTLVKPIGEEATKAVARREDRLLKQSIEAAQVESFEGLIGQSPAMQNIIRRIRKAARNKLTVLILGETGSGKEMIAQAVHNQSDRAKKAFKALNCAGLSETLIESELFGHTKGAFTGAVGDRKGYFAAADGGTLFLDEIGDMPVPMQAKLLRVLERREFTPVGSTEVQRVDVRLLAATNADLSAKVEQKEFRADLYYRLRQWVIEVPPLRDRRDDIPLLAHALLQQANAEHGLNIPNIASDAMSLLTRYFWPGNVRELKHVIEVAAVEAEDRPISADDLPEEIRGSRELVPTSGSTLVGLTMEQVERIMIERTLDATGGNREQAAKMLGIGTRTLYRKIREYELS